MQNIYISSVRKNVIISHERQCQNIFSIYYKFTLLSDDDMCNVTLTVFSFEATCIYQECDPLS